MNVLGIETSCDETAAAVYSSVGLLSNVIASQTIHHEYGGVVPELASREHIRLILPIIKKSLENANLNLNQINGVAVTYGPGLMGSILVGLNTAKAIAYALSLPWIGINHIEGHIFSIYLTNQKLKPPFIALIVSGGHTQLVYVEQSGHYEIMGRTLDDAAGEAFDKVAKMLNLGYPGGPIIDKLSSQGDETFVQFPRSIIKKSEYNFSFSGLKTAVLYYLKQMSEDKIRRHKADIAASFQAALVEVLVEKTIAAANDRNIRQIVLAGGVARNNFLRYLFYQRAKIEELHIYIPKPILCTDNAAMIAWLGYHKIQQGFRSEYSLAPVPGLNL